MWLSVMVLSTVLAAEKPKLAVLDVQPVGVEEAQAVAVGDALVQEVSRRGYFSVISSKEIRTLLGIERQRQLAGCAESRTTADVSHRARVVAGLQPTMATRSAVVMTMERSPTARPMSAGEARPGGRWHEHPHTARARSRAAMSRACASARSRNPGGQ